MAKKIFEKKLRFSGSKKGAMAKVLVTKGCGRSKSVPCSICYNPAFQDSNLGSK